MWMFVPWIRMRYACKLVLFLTSSSSSFSFLSLSLLPKKTRPNPSLVMDTKMENKSGVLRTRVETDLVRSRGNRVCLS
ncbi:hypothetical protein BO79DRAFT_53180 [Aspergillus costaricaensis CBS 115574]|uniref:Uncharacterized protein n=1 Tax=Aspergillus costaricaensis CBS 115574 TaxID=1448317 RepID=A0ACD1I2W4_9EURO|nr:hypothetical protein BO79DRAFT_53180 [Aspergillus costaricaensis CBS 115574]RAK84563.1 hypothetical protein BO79DRAFT_53180 [Aspergillus costaricaensis CBS 115574]